jgi:hypothetical protein
MMAPAPDPELPLRGFFLKAESLAAAAFRTIPFVGNDVADFFLRVVVPTCAPGRDRALGAVLRGARRVEDGIHVIIMRMLPLP